MANKKPIAPRGVSRPSKKPTPTPQKIDRESIFRVEGPHYNVRVWRTEDDVSEYSDNEPLKKTISSVLTIYPYNALGFAKFFLKYSRVAAVEVTNKYGEGEVLYNDWPK